MLSNVKCASSGGVANMATKKTNKPYCKFCCCCFLLLKSELTLKSRKHAQKPASTQ